MAVASTWRRERGNCEAEDYCLFRADDVRPVACSSLHPHDAVSNPALTAAFESLPSANFTVFGAPIAHDSALTTAGAQLYLSANWSLIAKFEGEFASGSQTYAGTATLRYTW
jgi:hypothetical protein